MRENWPTALASILESEGISDGKRGWQNDPDDNGGPTLCGVTYGNFCEWKRYPKPVGKAWNPAIVEELKAMSDDDLSGYYLLHKWSPIRGDELPSGVDVATADVCVLHGPGKAQEFLRRALGLAGKGKIDASVVEAANQAPSLSDVVRKIGEYRKAHYDAIIAANPKQAKWKKGWYNRTERVTAQCVELAEAADAARPVETDLGKADVAALVSLPDDPVTKSAISSTTVQHGAVVSGGGGGVVAAQVDIALGVAMKQQSFLDAVAAFLSSLLITPTHGLNWTFLCGLVALFGGLGVISHRLSKGDISGIFRGQS